jgi:hypothetical protein
MSDLETGFMGKLPDEVTCLVVDRQEGGGFFGFKQDVEPPRFAVVAVDSVVDSNDLRVQAAGPLDEADYEALVAAHEGQQEASIPPAKGRLTYTREMSREPLPFRVDRIVLDALPLVLWRPTRD